MQKNKMDKYIREKVEKDNKIPLKAEKIVGDFEEMMLMKENEKKVIRISLRTFIAVAASFIIIAFLGVNMYANKLGKPNVISAVEALFKEEVVEEDNEKIELQNIVKDEKNNVIDEQKEIVENQENIVDEKENTIKQEKNNNQTTNKTSTVSKTLYGDANCDGEVNLKDSVYIRRYVVGWEGYSLTEQGKINADVNMDGKIEEFDANVISEYLAGNYKKLPVKAASTTWVEKNVPGMRLKYPSNWAVTEVNRGAWNFQQGELACIFEGENNGYNFKVSIYEPYYDSNVKDFESMLRTIAEKHGEVYNEFYGSTGYNIGSTDSNHLEWREIMRNTNNDNKKMKECYHTWGGWVYKIVIDYDYNPSDPSGFTTAYRVIDEMIGSIKLKSY